MPKEYDASPLDTLDGEDAELSPRLGMRLVERGVDYKRSIRLYETVKANEDFYIGRQWEGVLRSENLPTPVFNVLKRVVSFTVASITGSSIKANVTVLPAAADSEEKRLGSELLSRELDALIERECLTEKLAELCRNAAVDGDGAIYLWWDAAAESGGSPGALRAEVIENTRVIFGNSEDAQVQSQPFIILCRRELRGAVKRRAREQHFEGWESIAASGRDGTGRLRPREEDDKVDVYLLLWREGRSGEIWGYEFTEQCALRQPWSLGIGRYPLAWLSWDRVAGSYHGQAMITGLIPNQVFINRAWAAAMVSLTTAAVPKVLFDRTRIRRWDNRPGAAMAMVGDVDGAVKMIEGVGMPPQIATFLQLAKEETEASLGATGVALGDARPDNTSAILALQRAAATPNERTRRSLYACTEELLRTALEFITEYYGVRGVSLPVSAAMREALTAAALPVPERTRTEVDFAALKDLPRELKLEIGESSYYSEIAAMTTLDNLLKCGAITPAQYLQRIPEGYIPGRQELIRELQNGAAMEDTHESLD